MSSCYLILFTDIIIMMYSLLVLSQTFKVLPQDENRTFTLVCYVNILFINLIKFQFLFQAFKSILVKCLSIHFQRIIDFLKKNLQEKLRGIFEKVLGWSSLLLSKKSYLLHICQVVLILATLFGKTLSAKN